MVHYRKEDFQVPHLSEQTYAKLARTILNPEIIRGIPSAEYGDLTSGLVVVHSKIGQTPWQIKGKINPGTMNYSLGKGLRLNKDAGILNFNLDYAQAWGRSTPENKVIRPLHL